MADGMMRITLALSFMLYGFAVAAADLPDPTRPPASITAVNTDAVPSHTPVITHSSGLQSTIVSATRRAAIIDGRTIELGGNFGNEKLVEVHEGSVVLQGEQNQRVLTLFSGVTKVQPDITIKKVPSTTGTQPDGFSAVAPNKKHLPKLLKEK